MERDGTSLTLLRPRFRHERQEARQAYAADPALWLVLFDQNVPIQDHWEHLSTSGPDNPWHEVDDEFGDPREFQSRHYNEFVTFRGTVSLRPGLGRAVRKVYGESPIEVMRRTDVRKARITSRKTAERSTSVSRTSIFTS